MPLFNRCLVDVEGDEEEIKNFSPWETDTSEDVAYPTFNNRISGTDRYKRFHFLA